jgi:hypothetical protein
VFHEYQKDRLILNFLSPALPDFNEIESESDQATRLIAREREANLLLTCFYLFVEVARRKEHADRSDTSLLDGIGKGRLFVRYLTYANLRNSLSPAKSTHSSGGRNRPSTMGRDRKYTIYKGGRYLRIYNVLFGPLANRSLLDNNIILEKYPAYIWRKRSSSSGQGRVGACSGYSRRRLPPIAFLDRISLRLSHFPTRDHIQVSRI